MPFPSTFAIFLEKILQRYPSPTPWVDDAASGQAQLVNSLPQYHERLSQAYRTGNDRVFADELARLVTEVLCVKVRLTITDPDRLRAQLRSYYERLEQACAAGNAKGFCATLADLFAKVICVEQQATNARFAQVLLQTGRIYDRLWAAAARQDKALFCESLADLFADVLLPELRQSQFVDECHFDVVVLILRQAGFPLQHREAARTAFLRLVREGDRGSMITLFKNELTLLFTMAT